MLGCTVPDAVAGRLNRAFGTSFDGHPAAEIDIAVTVDPASPPAASAAPATGIVIIGYLFNLIVA